MACGDGRHARWLAGRGWRTTGVDFSRVALDHARRADTDHQVEWVHADVTTWSPETPGDLVLIACLHLSTDDLTALLATAATWLAPASRLLYLGHARENHTRGVGGAPEVAVLPDIADLAGAADGHRVNELRHLIRPTARGNAIDVILNLTPWRAATTTSTGAAPDHSGLSH